MTTDDERIAYLAGDGPGAFDDAEREELDELKALLADPAVWAEPDPGLEDAVVAAIVSESAGRGRPWLHRLPVIGAVAAALLVAAVLIGTNQSDQSGEFAATLDPTELAPGAQGQATFTRTDSGWRIELDATGLPRLDDGRYYQAWLKNDDDVLVAIGSFNEGEDVVLWAGVSPVDFPTMTITEEATDGDQASSGQRVLVGPVTED